MESDPEKFKKNLEERKKPYSPDRFEGQYQSPWRFLVMSARSNLFHSIHWTSKLFQQYQNEIEKGIKSGEIYHTITTAYQLFLAGPLLATILLSAAAIETLFRISIRSHYERNMSGKIRGSGTQNSLSKKMAEFDRFGSFKKRDVLYSKLLKRNCSQELKEEFELLFTFRNECFHSDPILRRTDGYDESTKRGVPHVVSYERGVYPEYPLIWASNRPLSLTDSLRAIRVHDTIVEDFLGEHNLSYLFKFLQTNENEWKGFDIIESQYYLSLAFSQEGITHDDLDEIGKVWDSLVESKLRLVTDAEKDQYKFELLRKLSIKRVK